MTLLDHSNYSHGLEEIYQLEAVDINSVRPISQPVQEVEEEVRTHYPEPEPDLDLGTPFRRWIEPFFLKESIHTLNLSRNAEESLKKQGFLQLQDLIGADLQRHNDEVEKKLRNALEGRSLERSYQLDCGSWIRSLFYNIKPEKAHAYLKEFGLAYLFPLSKAQEFELRKGQIESTVELPDTHKQFKEITKAFIVPWMRERQGLVLSRQLIERLHQVALDPELVHPILRLFTKIQGTFPFTPHLHQVEETLFCSDPHLANLFGRLIARTHTYFYNSKVAYPLSSLETWLSREFAKEWQGFPEGFIPRALKLSSQFRTRRGECGEIVVRLS